MNAGVYEKLLAMEGGEKDNEIARDLNRTYPTHVFYQQSEGAGQKSLYHVLKTYSVYDKRVSRAELQVMMMQTSCMMAVITYAPPKLRARPHAHGHGEACQAA